MQGRLGRITPVKSENNYLVYESKDYGFKIKYPETWSKKVLNDQKEGYLTVVVFRNLMDHESESPSVTVYIDYIKSKGISFEDYVTKEIDEVVTDQNISLIEISDVVIANRPGIKLVDSEYHGYKRMVHWTHFNGMAFELSYESDQSEYEEFLSDVETMINSFELDTPVGAIDTETNPLGEDKNDNEDNPLMILKRRFAKGEISEEEFKKMRSVLEG